MAAPSGAPAAPSAPAAAPASTGTVSLAASTAEEAKVFHNKMFLDLGEEVGGGTESVSQIRRDGYLVPPPPLEDPTRSITRVSCSHWAWFINLGKTTNNIASLCLLQAYLTLVTSRLYRYGCRTHILWCCRVSPRCVQEILGCIPIALYCTTQEEQPFE